MSLSKNWPKSWTKAQRDAHLDAWERDLKGWPCHACDPTFTTDVPHTPGCTKG